MIKRRAVLAAGAGAAWLLAGTAVHIFDQRDSYKQPTKRQRLLMLLAGPLWIALAMTEDAPIIGRITNPVLDWFDDVDDRLGKKR